MLQAGSSYKVQLIQHAHRHADLRVYTFRAGQSSAPADAMQRTFEQPLLPLLDDAPADESDSSDSDTQAAASSGTLLRGSIAGSTVDFSLPEDEAITSMPKPHPATMLNAIQVRHHGVSNACTRVGRSRQDR